MKKNLIKFLALFSVGVLIFLAVFSFVGFGKISAAISELYLPLYIIVIGLGALDISVWSSRWGIFVHQKHPEVSHFSLLKNLLVGLAMNHISPLFKMGGEPARVYLLKVKNGIKGREGLATVTSDLTMEFIIDVVMVILGMVLFLVFFSPPIWIYGILTVFIVMSLVLVFGIVGIYSGQRIFYRFIGWLCEKVGRLKKYEERLTEAYSTFSENFRETMKNKGLLTKGIGLTVIRKIIAVVKYYLIFAALGYSVNLTVIVIAIGVGYMLMMIPATPGGLGIFEGGMISVFVLLGISPAVAATVVFLDRIIWYWSIMTIGSTLGTYYGINLLNAADIKSTNRLENKESRE